MSCSPAESEGLSRDDFVTLYMRLVRARIDAQGDSAAYAASRDRVLQDAGVTEEQMRDFVASRGNDPEELRRAWIEIAVKLDTLYGGVTIADPVRDLRAKPPAPAETATPKGTGPPDTDPVPDAVRSADTAGTPGAARSADTAVTPARP